MADAAVVHQRATLEIHDLHATVEGKEILKGIDLTVRQGETHALMGPNGSGKSTLANVLMGRPGYLVTSGDVRFKGEDILRLTPDQRAARCLVLAMQYPVEVPWACGAARKAAPTRPRHSWRRVAGGPARMSASPAGKRASAGQARARSR